MNLKDFNQKLKNILYLITCSINIFEKKLPSKELFKSPQIIKGKTKENITRFGTTVPDPVHVPDLVICPD